jgi:hypothetical protein
MKTFLAFLIAGMPCIAYRHRSPATQRFYSPSHHRAIFSRNQNGSLPGSRAWYFASHDLEDIITVVDGRPSLLAEVQASESKLRAYLGEAVAMLLSQSRFLDALPGFLPPDAANQARISQLTRNLSELSRLS